MALKLGENIVQDLYLDQYSSSHIIIDIALIDSTIFKLQKASLILIKLETLQDIPSL